jgi:branched-chain amino acid aminotransferase
VHLRRLETQYIYIAYELVTPPLDDVILPGITRQSTVELAQAHESGKSPLPGISGKIKVSERQITMKEVVAAADSGSLVEIFGTGESVESRR